MKVLISGGRNVGRPSEGADVARATQERKFVSDFLTNFHKAKPVSLVIAGNEGGAERLGLHWAALNKIPASVWERRTVTKEKMVANVLGKLAGKRGSSSETTIKRNLRMLAGSQPDLIIAFGCGETTTALLEEAKKRGVEILEVKLPGST